ncbi:hypothetical protein C2G38_2173576 [Gigaspora rosea]|uniref:Uncharacterized protein n=1 Tax=Gigaspora rosea TaxID=44941 RepID=A0A397VJF4_9GLOM|nr:hypothetical protein C2G38_2173576 [Gigaspora rosea]
MIFKSKYPDIEIPQVGIYQYVTSNPNKIPDDKVIYVDRVTDRSYTFGEFKHESKKFAAGLQDKLEFKRGDVLAIFSFNQYFVKIDYPNVVLGAIAAGGKVTTANPKYEATELSSHLSDSGASVLIVHPEILEVAIEASINANILTSRVLLFGDIEINGHKPYRSVLINDREIEPIYYTPEEAKSTTAYILYSSGTTGKPKGIEITHTSMAVRSAQEISVQSNLGPHSINMGVLVGHLEIPFEGATTIICSNFSVKSICESIQKFKIDHFYTAPPIILNLINDPLVQQFNLSSVDAIICTGAPLRDQLEKKFYDMFKIPILQGYGLTEMGEVTECSDTIESTIPGSVGILFPNMKAKILSDDGRELGCNEPGELWIHSPKTTDAVIDTDGFFNTGDIVSVDEQGYYFIVDRKKEFIRGLDFDIAPSELESILLTQEAVSDAAVIGYYSEKEEIEIPTAYVTIKNGYNRSQALAEEIRSFVNEKVLPYKRLTGDIMFIDRIPKTQSGKILRRVLKEN